MIQKELETFPSASQPPWNLEFHHPLPRRGASRQGRLSMTAAGPASDHMGQTVTELRPYRFAQHCGNLRDVGEIHAARPGRNRSVYYLRSTSCVASCVISYVAPCVT